MTTIDDIIEQIQILFDKKPNTIYGVRIVDEVYSGRVNIFFEYNKINRATTSRQIARLEGVCRSHVTELKQQIKAQTGLTVTVYYN